MSLCGYPRFAEVGTPDSRLVLHRASPQFNETLTRASEGGQLYTRHGSRPGPQVGIESRLEVDLFGAPCDSGSSLGCNWAIVARREGSSDTSKNGQMNFSGVCAAQLCLGPRRAANTVRRLHNARPTAPSGPRSEWPLCAYLRCATTRAALRAPHSRLCAPSHHHPL